MELEIIMLSKESQAQEEGHYFTSCVEDKYKKNEHIHTHIYTHTHTQTA
jgi:hypothetical protein